MDAVLLTEPTGGILAANPAACLMLGRSEAELMAVGRAGVLDLSDPRAAAAAEERNRVGRFRGELTLVRKDGSSFPADVSTAIFADRSGRLYTSMVARDVTARKAGEAALRRSQAELQAIYDTTPVMMCVTDAARHVRYANRAFADFIGRPAAELTHETACGVIGCLGALDDPGGCGFGPRCEICPMRRAMEGAISDGQVRRDVEYAFGVLRNGTPQEMVFQASVAPIPLAGEAGLLLCFEDVTTQRRADNELRTSRAQLRALAARLQTAREEERASVAREVHDVMAQALTRLKIDLVWLQRRLTRPFRITSTSALAARVLEMSKMADETIRSAQQIATALRPAVLDSLGLCAAVEWYVRDFQARTGIACRLDGEEDPDGSNRDVATAAFRILQEGLTNVLRHSKATAVDVVLRQSLSTVALTIRDNGCGMPASAAGNPAAIGIAGMRERAELLGGTFELSSAAGSGTTIVVRLPNAAPTAGAGDRQ